MLNYKEGSVDVVFRIHLPRLPGSRLCFVVAGGGRAQARRTGASRPSRALPAVPQGAAQLQPAAGQRAPADARAAWAREGLPAIEKIQDYTATVIKRERIGTTLGEDQYMAIKVRHKPFSVYMYFLAPAA